jgi:hypothetical protein
MVRSSAQAANTRESSKGPIKGDDFRNASLEAYFCNQMVGKTCCTIPGCVQCLSGEVSTLNGDASGSKQPVQRIENPLLFPSASEDPREFCQNDEREEDSIPRTGLRESRPRFPRLSLIVVEEGTRPDIGIGG